MPETLLITIDQNIATVTLNRPEHLNALNADVLRELTQTVRQLDARPDVRCLVLTGAGDKAFCAGADVKAMAAMNFAQADEFAHLGHACMSAVENASKPVIGKINGFALGGGMELALSCDFLYAADTAQFGLPETTIGLYPGFGGTQRLPRLVGRNRACELIFTGRRLMAAEARDWGLVNAVIVKAELDAAVTAVARTITANAPLAIQSAKRVILKGEEMGLTAGLAFERETFPVCFVTSDCRTGLQAFVEKRKPVYEGK